MHQSVRDFLELLKSRTPEVFNVRRVLEFGSYDMNGSARRYFINENVEYVGLDHRPGPGVTVVRLMHKYNSPPFDTIISTSTLEHDPYHEQSLFRMAQLVKVGGSLIITTVTPGWPEHEVDVAPGYNEVPEGKYYQNVDPLTILKSVMDAARFQTIYFVEDAEKHEVFVFFQGKIR